MADGQHQAFGLDQRTKLLELSTEVRTPPTPAVPTSNTINPARFYALPETETFMMCWAYCGEVPFTARFRDALVASLDAELELLPLDVQPTPTPARDPSERTDEFVTLQFGHLMPGWINQSFGLDLETGLLLLPHDGGWVRASQELIDLVLSVEPPPGPF